MALGDGYWTAFYSAGLEKIVTCFKCNGAYPDRFLNVLFTNHGEETGKWCCVACADTFFFEGGLKGEYNSRLLDEFYEWLGQQPTPRPEGG